MLGLLARDEGVDGEGQRDAVNVSKVSSVLVTLFVTLPWVTSING